jgi:hypothetical protein
LLPCHVGAWILQAAPFDLRFRSPRRAGARRLDGRDRFLFSGDSSSAPTLLLATGGTVLSILSAFLIFVNLVAGQYRLSLSEAGLDYSLFKCGPLDWSDIRSVAVKPYFSSEVVSLEVADAEKYFARGLPKGNRNTGRYARALSSPFVIYPQQLQISADALLRAINERVALFGRAAETQARNP